MTEATLNDWAQFVAVVFLFIGPIALTLACLCMVAYVRMLRVTVNEVEARVNTLLKAFCAGLNRQDPLDVLAKNLEELGIRLTRTPLPEPTHKPEAGLQ